MKLELKKEELLILNNSLNEVLELLPEIDFTTRIGGSKDEILKLLNRIGEELKNSRQLFMEEPIWVDFGNADEDGKMIGIKITNASKKLPKELLDLAE